jgi:hypothetical protein
MKVSRPLAVVIGALSAGLFAFTIVFMLWFVLLLVALPGGVMRLRPLVDQINPAWFFVGVVVSTPLSFILLLFLLYVVWTSEAKMEIKAIATAASLWLGPLVLPFTWYYFVWKHPTSPLLTQTSGTPN